MVTLPTPATSEYVWYASYGSNLKRDRFLHYIHGGTPEGCQRQHEGCQSRQDPLTDAPAILVRKLVFARDRGGWNGGAAAFVSDPESPPKSAGADADQQCRAGTCDSPRVYARMYRILRQQFIDVFAQENLIAPGAFTARIDFEKLHRDASCVITEGPYNLLVFLGNMRVSDGREPVYTITSSGSLEYEGADPSREYLQTIVSGLIESHPYLSNNAIHAYLRQSLVDSPIWTRAAVFDLLLEMRAKWRESSSARHWYEARQTAERGGARREFIAQLHPEIRKRGGVNEGDRLVLERPTVLVARRGLDGNPIIVQRFAGRITPIQVIAVLNCANERKATVEPSKGPQAKHVFAQNQIALDQKLRDALGIEAGGWVRVLSAARQPYGRSWLRGFMERLLGSQPELMRVHRATFEDMEISVCRIPESTPDILGIRFGDSVLIESRRGQLRLRAAKLSEKQWEHRQRRMRATPGETPDPYEFLELNRLPEYFEGTDLPPVLIDQQARQRLEVDVGDAVRVVRHATRALVFRVYFILIPSLLAAVPFFRGVQNDPNLISVGARTLIALAVFLIVASLLFALVVVDLRNKIE